MGVSEQIDDIYEYIKAIGEKFEDSMRELGNQRDLLEFWADGISRLKTENGKLQKEKERLQDENVKL